MTEPIVELTGVEVDFNNASMHTITENLRHANGPVKVGDMVVLYDPAEDDCWFYATVTSVDEANGYASYKIMWD